MSVRLRFTDSDYPFGIFKLFLCITHYQQCLPFYVIKILCRNRCVYIVIVTSGAGTAYPSGVPEFTSGIQWSSSIFSFMCMFCRQLFVLFYLFFCPLCCLFVFDIRILVNPLVSSKSSQYNILKKQSSKLNYR